LIENFFSGSYRIGFCGEAHPRFILPTEIESIRDVLKKTEKNLYDQAVDFFNKIFFE
jgi:actin-related protein